MKSYIDSYIRYSKQFISKGHNAFGPVARSYHQLHILVTSRDENATSRYAKYDAIRRLAQHKLPTAKLGISLAVTYAQTEPRSAKICPIVILKALFFVSLNFFLTQL